MMLMQKKCSLADVPTSINVYRRIFNVECNLSYQLPPILTALLHVDTINVACFTCLTACAFIRSLWRCISCTDVTASNYIYRRTFNVEYNLSYQLPLILTALLHVDLINVPYLTACALSGHHDVAFFE